uniref:hypothetical protein n=1 Tax=Salmonella enterica TaxID=28901 RepID=UPI00398C5155
MGGERRIAELKGEIKGKNKEGIGREEIDGRKQDRKRVDKRNEKDINSGKRVMKWWKKEDEERKRKIKLSGQRERGIDNK